MKNVIGATLHKVEAGAPNNNGGRKNTSAKNFIVTKTIQSPEGLRTYITQANFRREQRNVLEDKFDWNMSPVQKIDSNQASTECDPYKYADDDLFGYMFVKQGKENVKRLSPYKCQTMIGLPISPVDDFGVFNRNIKGDPIPFNHQIYSNIMKSGFSLNLDEVGVFQKSNDPQNNNLSSKKAKEYEKEGLKIDEDVFKIPDDERQKRVNDLLRSFNYIRGGAMQTLHMTNLRPKFIILSTIDSGVNIFSDILPHEDYKKGLINIEALNTVIEEHQDDFLTNIYIGMFPGFGTNTDKTNINGYKLPETVDNLNVYVTTPHKAIEQFITEMEDKNLIGG